MTISKQTAIDIAMAYREVETGEQLLTEITDAIRQRKEPDLRDAFGRRHGGLELGVPTSNTARRLFEVPWNLAQPIIEAHIARQKAIIAALCEKARAELDLPSTLQPQEETTTHG